MVWQETARPSNQRGMIRHSAVDEHDDGDAFALWTLFPLGEVSEKPASSQLGVFLFLMDAS